MHLIHRFNAGKKSQMFVRLHNSLYVVFSVWSGRLSLHVAGLPVGRSVPAQVMHVGLRCRLLLLAVGPLAGAGARAVGASPRVEGALRGYVLAEHDHPVLQVTDGARRAAGGTVESPPRVEPPLQFQHCGNGQVHHTDGVPSRVRDLRFVFKKTVF